MTSVAMSTRLTSASPSVVSVRRSSAPPDGAREGDRRRGVLQAAQEIERFDDTVGPRLRRGIVERDDEIAFGRGAEPPLDDRPRLQIVGQRDRAEVVTERRAEPCGRRLHGGDAGHDRDVERRAIAARPRSPRTPPPPWRTRPGRRRRRQRPCAPLRRASARDGRGRVRRDCRSRARAGRARASAARHRARSRRRRSRPRSPRRPRASSIRPGRGRGRRSASRPVTAAARSPAPGSSKNRARPRRSCRKAA